MPDAERGPLSRKIGALNLADPRRLGWQSHCRESGAEGVVEEGDEAGTAAIVLGERVGAAAGGLLDLGSDMGDEVGGGAAEAVDRLLRVSGMNAAR